MVTIGPVMLDIKSFTLSSEDRYLLTKKLVGGVILFSRNFQSAEQIFELTCAIRQINPSVIIAVDQEGGRVQRFREGFSNLPPLGQLGVLSETDLQSAIAHSHDLGELMALEVQSVGCDISFAPVLDLGFSISKVIGDRAFSTTVDTITVLAKAFVSGMRGAGMVATGKHFPGHGSVEADSHVSIPFDNRSLEEIKTRDLQPFANLSSDLGAIMPAHVIYSQVDNQPAGFSEIWLQKVLREELGFGGVIFSDDLSMKGAEVAGGFGKRATKALAAGCDMVLICNDPQGAKEVLAELSDFNVSGCSQKRLLNLKMKSTPKTLAGLKQTDRWQHLDRRLKEFNQLVSDKG